MDRQGRRGGSFGAGASAAALIATAIGAGCGDNDAPVSVPYVSGTRLRANLLDGGEGAVLFVDWHDNQLDVDCTFSLAADGTMRCLPQGGAQIVYGDETCATPVAADLSDPACPPPRYAHLGPWSGRACAAEGDEVYPVGASIGRGPIYYRTGTGCDRWPFEFPRFAVGAPVTAQFVGEQSRATDVLAGGAAATVITATDGAQQVYEMIDPARGPCFLARLWSDTDACVAGLAYGGEIDEVYGDAACATLIPASTYSACDAGAPAVVVTRPIDQPDAPWSVHLTGPRIEGPVYWAFGASCAVAVDYTGYQIGRPATADDFPLLSTLVRGTGRVHARYAADLAGRALRSLGLDDATTGDECMIVAIAGEPGLRRCLPWGAIYASGSSSLFADAACTVPAWSARTEDAQPDGLIATTERTCVPFPFTISALARQVEHTGPIYESDSTGTCMEAPRQAGARYVVTGAGVSLDDFPAVITRTE